MLLVCVGRGLAPSEQKVRKCKSQQRKATKVKLSDTIFLRGPQEAH